MYDHAHFNRRIIMTILTGIIFLACFCLFFYFVIIPAVEKTEKDANRVRSKYEKKMEGLKGVNKKKN